MGKGRGSSPISIIKRIAVIALISIVAVLIPAIIRTLLIETLPEPVPCERKDEDFISDSRGLSKRLAQAIQFKTVSISRNDYNRTELIRFVNYIKQTFPLIHSSSFIQHEIVNNYSLLYKVQGKNNALKPYMLCAHLDVVPVDEDKWEMPPFDGQIIDGFLYGRGTIDDKCNAMGILEALEFMLERKTQPERSFYIAFGHDEEVNGLDGAAEIAKLLIKRNVKLQYLLDEGSFIMRNIVAGVQSPVAMVGISEKGYLTLKLSVNAVAGHSSMPPVETAIVTLSKALSQLKGDLHPNLFGKGPEVEMLRQIAPYASFPFKFIFSNLWLFSPLVAWVYDRNIITSSTVRTTTAVTMIGGGIKENVVPNNVWAIVNHRVHPAQTIEEVIKFDKEQINDPRVKIEILQATEAHPLSPHDDSTYGYQIIKSTVRQLKPGLPVVPISMVANTDTRWYLSLTNEIYRFSVFSLDKAELHIIHGHNERISIECYERVVNFYYHLILNSNSETIPTSISHTEL